uniref:Putative monocarboxylate transporter n=1 Tax=Amblyomma aureolatum TaxID=187763 RepID=A0A1E1X915_9ACAR
MVPYTRAADDAESSTSWPTVLASGWLFFFSSALFRSYGLFYLHLVRTVHMSRAAAALPIALIAAAAGVSSALCGVVSKRVPVIISNLFCCLVCGAALCIPYFLPTTSGLALAGIFYGLGLGPIEWRSQTLIKKCFKKHRILALGVSTLGVTFAGIVFPWLLLHLLREYATPGACLLLGAITLNGCIGTLLQKLAAPRSATARRRVLLPSVAAVENGNVEMRVVRKRQSVSIDANPQMVGVSSRLSSKQDRGSAPEGLNRTAGGTNGAAATSYSYQKLRSVSSSNIPAEKADQRPSDTLRDGFGLHQLAGDGALSQDSIYEDCQSDFDPCELEGLPTFKRRRLLTEGSETYLSCYSVLDPSLYDVVETKDTGEVTIHRRSVSSESIVIVPVQTKLQGPLKERLRVLFKPAWVLLKNGMFYICSLSFVLLYTINVIYNSTVLDFALDKGVGAGSIVSLLSVFSVADLIARLATSVLMNSEMGSKKLLMIWVQASSGVLLLAAPYLVGYSAALVAALLLGANLGSLSVLYIILFEDYIGLHLVAWAFGIYGVAIGVLALLMVPIISYCRDLLLSYDTLFQVMGLICLLNVFFWAFAEPFFKKKRVSARKSQENSRQQ